MGKAVRDGWGGSTHPSKAKQGGLKPTPREKWGGVVGGGTPTHQHGEGVLPPPPHRHEVSAIPVQPWGWRGNQTDHATGSERAYGEGGQREKGSL